MTISVSLSQGPYYSFAPAATERPYALMTICDVQRHLVAAGKLPRSGVDGAWGPQSKNALLAFVKTMPLAVVRAVYTDNQDRGNVPPLGSREDYKLIGTTQIRIPQAYVLAFPAKASVTCGRPAGSGTSTGGGTTTTGTDQTTTTTTVTDETGPSLEEQLATSRGGAGSSGFSPWLILAGVALGAVAISAARKRGGMNGLDDDSSDCGCGG
jgi:hypothetical protein